jgi:hypothetical protein
MVAGTPAFPRHCLGYPSSDGGLYTPLGYAGAET